ncbi:alpha/beta hydrolase [Pontibacter sp. G13]|uniref:alpha/beta hydrolase family protein n=1 Tax=Pontibacter sp. G13 TaxID=3074898 RepID=UPI00288A687B|nr:alpha/beta hydrolase [Pontibacter sp. G13]WNJ21025.1 alpha/beta hydrolase [Pontibacter sp. G13]
MKSILPILTLAICMMMGIGSAQAQTFPTGSWGGKLDLGSMELRLILNVSQGEDGVLQGTLDSPDQGAKGLPVDKVSFENNVLTFTAMGGAATYEGTYDAAQSQVSGTFSQAGQQFPLVLTPAGETGPPKRPQTPQPPYAYGIEELEIPNEEAGITLTGTLTYPPNRAIKSAIVLVSGSGPQDRDETIMGHKPFAVLADAFTKAGYAVFRYDDRGVGASTGQFATATTEDFASDALAVVKFLQKRADIDPDKIVVAGHSEGGAIATMLAAHHSEVAGAIFMAGPGVAMDEILIQQERDLFVKSGFEPELMDRWKLVKEKLYKAVLNSNDEGELEQIILAQAEDWLADITPEERQMLDATPEKLTQSIRTLSSPWMRFFLSYDPAKDLQSIKCPVLAINGSKDIQVAPKQNLTAIQQNLEAGKCKDITVQELEGLNHLFQTADTGLPIEYNQIEETFAPSAIEVMIEWLKPRFPDYQ